MNIRIVVVAKHRLMASAIGALLGTMRNLKVVAIAINREDIADAIPSKSPDVFLIDDDAFKDQGDLANELLRLSPGVPLIVLATEPAYGGFLDALRSGTVSVVLKDAPDAELYRAIKTVIGGTRYLSPAVAEHAIDFAAEAKGVSQQVRALTSRQQEILRLLAEGYATKEVADRLDLSPRTVESHRYRIMERLGVRNLAGLVQYAIRTGVIKAS